MRALLPAAFIVVPTALLFGACTGGAQVDTSPATTTTSSGSEMQEDGEPVVSSEGDPEEQASTEPTTPEQAAGLTESSLTDSTAPLVTSPDDVEPHQPIGSDALEDLLIDEFANFDLIPEATADRFLDISAAAAIQPDPSGELPLLETRGYQGGWTRAFRDENNNVLITTVYDFISALEADFYLEDGTITIIGSGGTIYEVASIPGGRGFRQDGQDESGLLVTYGITFTRNNQWYLVYLLGDPATATPDVILAAAEAQAKAASN